ncbi:MAG: 2-octaprenyl-3-methyl-6-methoxy-1,4-benzoquinol hydroxylase [Micavibrio sp.]|nr:MAG: 2-octaprenyl-3-methyl-6-methoxy-1,4-benzoquinol hydroxylase [Micavibrio sp.]
MNEDIYDIAIIGGGLAGMSLACLLGDSGLSVACIDQADPEQQIKTDGRTTAVSYGSRKILEEAGIWDDLDQQACPIDDIRILDGASPVLLNFLSTEAEDKSFGWIADNSAIRKALLKRIQSLKTIDHLAPQKISDFAREDDHVKCLFQEGEAIKARLVIGADGRGSFTREWMGVRTREWNYRQRAVICAVEHEHPHDNMAVEHFWPSGPFAILPMADDDKGIHRSSVVFTEHGKKKDSLMRLDNTEFEVELASRFPKEYGTVRMINERMCFPLSLIHAAEYIAPRMALVADAAHGIHPIAGQGLNLGFRDVKALADLVRGAHECGEDIGSDELLQTYQRQRRFDNMSMVAVTDGLVRLFSNNIPPVRFIRRAGLKAVSKFPPAKRFFMKQAMGDR